MVPPSQITPARLPALRLGTLTILPVAIGMLVDKAVSISDSQAAYPDDVGPALNTAAGEPFRRSSLSREVIPELPPAGATPPFPEPSTDVAPKSVVPEKSTNAAPRVNFPVLPGNRSPR